MYLIRLHFKISITLTKLHCTSTPLLYIVIFYTVKNLSSTETGNPLVGISALPPDIVPVL